MKKILVLSVLALASSGLAANCRKGKPCGNSCIPVTSTCHIGAPTTTPTLPITLPEPIYAPAPTPTVTRTYTPGYGNCSAARAAGVSNILTSDPNYHPDLDRDGDGIACEAGGDDSGASVAGWQAPVRVAPTFIASNLYDTKLRVGRIPFTCAGGAEFGIVPEGEVREINFFIDPVPLADLLVTVSVGETRVFRSAQLGNFAIKLDKVYANWPIKLTAEALDKNKVCPSELTLRNISLK